MLLDQVPAIGQLERHWAILLLTIVIGIVLTLIMSLMILQKRFDDASPLIEAEPPEFIDNRKS